MEHGEPDTFDLDRFVRAMRLMDHSFCSRRSMEAEIWPPPRLGRMKSAICAVMFG